MKLQYLKGSKECSVPGFDGRMWNLLSPQLPGYDYTIGCTPTFTLEGLKERGLI